MTQKQRFKDIIAYFKTNQPVAETELHYRDPFSLLVAVILSAQCTDKRVNLITPKLMEQFPSPQKMADAEVFEIFEYIKSCSFPNNKAIHLQGMAQMLVKDFAGAIPNSIDELQKLPGVGRKTANVIVSVVYNQPAMAVDTHVFRVSNRLGLTKNSKTPLETEKVLVKHIPQDLLPIAHHWLILHGRYICLARTPQCSKCPLTEWCLFYEKQSKQPSND